ncbi:hypothetical protein O1611_g736 [Lasiodiplodia mahajangana]|uniref:Uncharacterized protein n=1 Tax=Lasiodiplodia mahajangana TaxID=1108764 RepID=A0ACC2K066_9PEZI|nr:hypothetical protein O1611_g736 [Lasiodiplodia mahajangana]
MNCACRTKSLRIFVQSLTEFRVTDPIISRSVRPNCLGSPIAFYRAPARRPTRLFSSTSAAYSQPKWLDESDSSSAEKIETKPSDIFDTVADLPSVSADDITSAKLNGTILDFNPESIDTLVSSLGRESQAEQAHDDPAAESQLQSRPKPPITSSQLKRRKIIKYDPTPRPDKKEEQGGYRAPWQIQKQALKEKFPEGWRPRKRLSPDALDGIRALHTQFPEQYTTEVLATHFQVSVEAIRRILRSKWTPSPEEEINRQERWFNRGKNIWSHMAALGKKPPRKWRKEGIVRDHHWNEKKGPRTEYPYMPQREESEDEELVESTQRKLSSNLL